MPAYTIFCAPRSSCLDLCHFVWKCKLRLICLNYANEKNSNLKTECKTDAGDLNRYTIELKLWTNYMQVTYLSFGSVLTTTVLKFSSSSGLFCSSQLGLNVTGFINRLSFSRPFTSFSATGSNNYIISTGSLWHSSLPQNHIMWYSPSQRISLFNLSYIHDYSDLHIFNVNH